MGTNLNSAFVISVLKKKICYVVDENNSSRKFNNKKIISIKNHKKTNLPLIVFFGIRNEIITNKIKNKYNISEIIKL